MYSMSVLYLINGTLFKITTANAFVQWCVWLVMIHMMETMRSYWWDAGNWQESFKTSKVWQQLTVFLVTLHWSFCTLTLTMPFTVIVGSSFASAGFFFFWNRKKLVAKYFFYSSAVYKWSVSFRRRNVVQAWKIVPCCVHVHKSYTYCSVTISPSAVILCWTIRPLWITQASRRKLAKYFEC